MWRKLPFVAAVQHIGGVLQKALQSISLLQVVPVPNSRPIPAPYPLARIAGWQLLTSIAVAVAGAVWVGFHGALSGFLGGVVNISAGIVYGVLVRASPATAVGTMRTMLRAEASKITLIVLQLWLILTTYKEIVHAVFFGAFVATVLVTTAAILIRD